MHGEDGKQHRHGRYVQLSRFPVEYSLQAARETALTCDACGLTYDEFLRTGKLGCTRCYQVFSEQLKPLLLRVHGRNQHAGRVPPGREKERELEQCLSGLRAQMDKAVNDENFEQAAVLRDEIKALCDRQNAEANPQ